MRNADLDTDDIVASILNSDTIGEAFELYKFAAPLLPDYKFVFASNDTGSQPGHAVNRTFENGAAIRSLFKTDRVLMLDPETLKEMQTGLSKFQIDYSISLDTNAMSYLEPYVAGKRGGGIPADFTEVFHFIAQPEVSVDPVPYYTENLFELSEGKSAESVFSNIRAYEILRTIDIDQLKKHGEIRSLVDDLELNSRAQRMVSNMLYSLENKRGVTDLKNKHGFVYGCLLKMAEVQLRSPQAPLESKMEKFVEFCHAKLHTMAAREMTIAKTFFTFGQKIGFFGKIQKNRTDILKTLKNMAWDLWHIRQLEHSLAKRPENLARYFFPALLTFDKDLLAIMDLYSLKSVAYSTNNYKPIPVFDGDPYLVIGANEQHGEKMAERYYSDSAKAERDSRRDLRSVDETVQELEQIVLSITLPKQLNTA